MTGFGSFKKSVCNRVQNLLDAGYLRLRKVVIKRTRWLYCVECSQYSIWLEGPSYVCASCLLPAFDAASVKWLNSRSSDVLLTGVRRRLKFGEVSCMECTCQGNDFQLILTVKMETRHNNNKNNNDNIICIAPWSPRLQRRWWRFQKLHGNRCF